MDKLDKSIKDLFFKTYNELQVEIKNNDKIKQEIVEAPIEEAPVEEKLTIEPFSKPEF